MLRGVAKPNAIAYIDGFNFYHGVAKDSPEPEMTKISRHCAIELPEGYDVRRSELLHGEGQRPPSQYQPESATE